MLDKKLKGQVKLAAWQLGIAVIAIIGYFVMSAALNDYYDVWGQGAKIDFDAMEQSVKTKILIGLFLTITLGITSFVLWIIGIVKAVAIQGITHDSTVLVVFSVLTLLFAHLIAAVVQKNKFYGKTMNGIPQSIDTNSYEQQLKQQLIDGTISSQEYEQKLNEHKNKNQ